MRIGVWGVTETATPNKAVGAVALTSATAALVCGVCCVLPLALPAVILGSVGGVLAWLSNAYAWLTPISVVAVISGWGWVIIQSVRTDRRPAHSTIATMAFATFAMILALMWPMVEEPISSLLRH